MNWIPGFVFALAGGWFLTRWLDPVWLQHGPRALRLAGRSGLAVLFATGLTSILYFILLLTNLAREGFVFGALAVYTAAAAALWWFRRSATPPQAPVPGRFRWNWALLGALAVASLFLALDFAAATRANPNGDWDATAIWNLRARFLAGGTEVWRRAISAEIGGFMVGSSHPGYPLCLSSFLAMLWTMAGTYTTAVPVLTSLLISAAVLALLIAGVAAYRGTAAGLLAGLLLAGTELFAAQTAAQYSDLLLGLAFLVGLMCLDAAGRSAPADRSTLIAAGLAIGFAPWIKNEGIPFAAAALAAVVWRFRARGLLWVLAGAAPGCVATLVLKLLAEGRESMFPATVSEAAAKLTSPARWWEVLRGFGDAFMQLGPWWAHPLLLLAVLALVLRFLPARELRSRAWLAAPVVVTLAAEFGLYLISTAGLEWHIGTSVTRLVVQIWPSLLWLLMSSMRAPDEYFAASGIVAAKQAATSPRGKARARR